ncbi:hypothetical protein ACFQ0G_11125 [Streptomyces chiangmaiensis]
MFRAISTTITVAAAITSGVRQRFMETSLVSCCRAGIRAPDTGGTLPSVRWRGT